MDGVMKHVAMLVVGTTARLLVVGLALPRQREL